MYLHFFQSKMQGRDHLNQTRMINSNAFYEIQNTKVIKVFEFGQIFNLFQQFSSILQFHSRDCLFKRLFIGIIALQLCTLFAKCLQAFFNTHIVYSIQFNVQFETHCVLLCGRQLVHSIENCPYIVSSFINEVQK